MGGRHSKNTSEHQAVMNRRRSGTLLAEESDGSRKAGGRTNTGQKRERGVVNGLFSQDKPGRSFSCGSSSIRRLWLVSQVGKVKNKRLKVKREK